MKKVIEAFNVFEKGAELYESKYMDVSAYAPALDHFLALTEYSEPQILEVACGPGNLTRYILNKRPSLKILATDFSPQMIALAKKNCPAADFEVLDCRNINELQQQFHSIVIGFCLPYLNMQEAVNLIGDASQLLYPSGVIYLSTIENAHSNSGLIQTSTGDEVMMNYYELNDIISMFSEAGLHLHIHKRVSNPKNPYKDVELVVVGQKKK